MKKRGRPPLPLEIREARATERKTRAKEARAANGCGRKGRPRKYATKEDAIEAGRERARIRSRAKPRKPRKPPMTVEERRIKRKEWSRQYRQKAGQRRDPKTPWHSAVSYDRKRCFETMSYDAWVSKIGPCVYCGGQSASFDRIDNGSGHTEDNCIPACGLCNMTRGNRFTVDEMKLIGPVIRQIMDTRSVT